MSSAPTANDLAGRAYAVVAGALAIAALGMSAFGLWVARVGLAKLPDISPADLPAASSTMYQAAGLLLLIAVIYAVLAAFARRRSIIPVSISVALLAVASVGKSGLDLDHYGFHVIMTAFNACAWAGLVAALGTWRRRPSAV